MFAIMVSLAVLGEANPQIKVTLAVEVNEVCVHDPLCVSTTVVNISNGPLNFARILDSGVGTIVYEVKAPDGDFQVIWDNRWKDRGINLKWTMKSDVKWRDHQILFRNPHDYSFVFSKTGTHQIRARAKHLESWIASPLLTIEVKEDTLEHRRRARKYDREIDGQLPLAYPWTRQPIPSLGIEGSNLHTTLYWIGRVHGFVHSSPGQRDSKEDSIFRQFVDLPAVTREHIYLRMAKDAVHKKEWDRAVRLLDEIEGSSLLIAWMRQEIHSHIETNKSQQ